MNFVGLTTRRSASSVIIVFVLVHYDFTALIKHLLLPILTAAIK